MRINEIIVEGWFGSSKEEREAREKEIEKEKKYFAHLSINGAKTAQEKDDYNRLYQKYGEYDIRRSGEMSNVDREKYEKMYRDEEWKRKYGTTSVNLKPLSATSTKSSDKELRDEYKNLRHKLSTGRITGNERIRYDELYLKLVKGL
jgi:hypothetical protein